MGINCLGPDGVVRNVNWQYVKSAWLPAIVTCNQSLYSYVPVIPPVGMTMEVVDLVVTDNATTVTPTKNRTICRFPESLSSTITLSADISNCSAGDELIVIFSSIFSEDSTDAKLQFPVDTFFMNWDIEDGFVVVTPRLNTWMVIFTFDGTKFTSTYEHC